MNFGERIYELRSQKGMSQGELAERLYVSRQAVSKWENNSAVPELDKLLKMSELFGISLDELIKGEAFSSDGTQAKNIVSQEAVPIVIKQILPMRKIAGLILFGMAFITAIVFFTMGGFLAMLYGLPFAVCGIICFYCEKHPGLICLWTLSFIIQIFLASVTGVFAFGFDALLTGEWSVTALVALLVAAVNVFMIVFTSVRLKDEPIKKENKARKNLILLWCSIAVAYFIKIAANSLLGHLMNKVHESDGAILVLENVFYFFNIFNSLIIVVLFAVAVSFSVRYIKLKKAK